MLHHGPRQRHSLRSVRARRGRRLSLPRRQHRARRDARAASARHQRGRPHERHHHPGRQPWPGPERGSVAHGPGRSGQRGAGAARRRDPAPGSQALERAGLSRRPVRHPRLRTGGLGVWIHTRASRRWALRRTCRPSKPGPPALPRGRLVRGGRDALRGAVRRAAVHGDHARDDDCAGAPRSARSPHDVQASAARPVRPVPGPAAPGFRRSAPPARRSPPAWDWAPRRQR